MQLHGRFATRAQFDGKYDMVNMQLDGKYGKRKAGPSPRMMTESTTDVG